MYKLQDTLTRSINLLLLFSSKCRVNTALLQDIILSAISNNQYKIIHHVSSVLMSDEAGLPADRRKKPGGGKNWGEAGGGQHLFCTLLTFKMPKKVFIMNALILTVFFRFISRKQKLESTVIDVN